jgi:hypothetical protein
MAFVEWQSDAFNIEEVRFRLDQRLSQPYFRRLWTSYIWNTQISASNPSYNWGWKDLVSGQRYMVTRTTPNELSVAILRFDRYEKHPQEIIRKRQSTIMARLAAARQQRDALLDNQGDETEDEHDDEVLEEIKGRIYSLKAYSAAEYYALVFTDCATQKEYTIDPHGPNDGGRYEVTDLFSWGWTNVSVVSHYAGNGEWIRYSSDQKQGERRLDYFRVSGYARYIKLKATVRRIERGWYWATVDPAKLPCKKRLRREFEELSK